MITAPNRHRPAFTLVEMLVATALILFMMYIIASAFESGLKAFRTLKVQGDLQEKLRQAVTVIRTDLSAPHFGGDTSPDVQGPYLSDHRLNDQNWLPPQKGYFRIALPNAAGTVEGLDPDGNPDPTQLLALPYFHLDPASLS